MPVDNAALDAAARAWDVTKEALDDVTRRIHDGVPLAELQSRADYNANMVLSFVEGSPSRALEIGPGVGMILEAVAARLPESQFFGLDISPSMAEMARARVPASVNASFHTYDGVTMPFPDAHFDLIYSVAALQHIPKPHVYHIFFEIKRLLTPQGFAVLHLLHWQDALKNETWWSWAEEVAQQIGKPPSSGRNSHGHWHHYYGVEEIETVLRLTGFTRVYTQGELWVCFSP
jgi:ubiquinone/menaquinone biosynthesis C-methylase UbiE